MNKCFNEYPVYRNRRYVSSYSRRTRSRSTACDLYERALSVCESIVAFFENSLVRLAIRIVALSAAFIGFFMLVAAAEAGSIGFATGVLSALGVVAASAFVLRI